MQHDKALFQERRFDLDMNKLVKILMSSLKDDNEVESGLTELDFSDSSFLKHVRSSSILSQRLAQVIVVDFLFNDMISETVRNIFSDNPIITFLFHHLSSISFEKDFKIVISWVVYQIVYSVVYKHSIFRKLITSLEDVESVLCRTKIFVKKSSTERIRYLNQMRGTYDDEICNFLQVINIDINRGSLYEDLMDFHHYINELLET